MLGLLVLFILNARRAGALLAGTKRCLLFFAALLVGVAFVGFGDVLVGRITAQGLYDPGRPAVLMVTIRSILSAPLLGFGYGTFSTAFPMFRDDSIGVWLVWDKAHNTYLEIFQGLGLVFGGDVDRMRGRSGLGLREGGEDTATRRNNPGHRGERFFPGGVACARRLQPADSGGDFDLYGGSGRRGRAGAGG